MSLSEPAIRYSSEMDGATTNQYRMEHHCDWPVMDFNLLLAEFFMRMRSCQKNHTDCHQWRGRYPHLTLPMVCILW